ncbi:AraC family transcriptional regulator [Rheinheimera riviphila]|uniref:AraC family transcriptional regulator n=1 Tax=Rheinheimera riviphila TaxID=1834037 RepID=A0A437QC68_9GAMM|nr:AraC family transcriptional regulator [Rheinheimera riviphila]RVU31963.1 AraC family transcriptional regulator [Rheinheimera riviphila]
MTENPLALFLNAASLAIIAFSGHLLLQRAKHQSFYWPLLGCLVAIAVLIVDPWLKQLAPDLRQLFLLLSLPALYLLPPCFWLYVQGLTSCSPWRLQASHAKHFVLSGIALVIVIGALLLPAEIRHGLLVEGSDNILQSTTAVLRNFVYGLAILTFGLVIGWCVQAGCYVVAVFRRLHRYRDQLKQVFASTETHELRWILWLLLAVVGIWLFAAASLLYDNLIGPLQTDLALKNLVVFVLIWTLASWGLRQKPGFAELYQPDAEMQETLPTLQTLTEAKYQRSALNEQLSGNIVNKLHKAMTQDQLFLDAGLSLPKLAKHIATSPSYISQTLNETLGVNFFDYVNRYRVEAAKIQLLTSNETVLDIAMNVGFNAKSSFYTAFKKETQLTPSQFRNARRQAQ